MSHLTHCFASDVGESSAPIGRSSGGHTRQASRDPRALSSTRTPTAGPAVCGTGRPSSCPARQPPVAAPLPHRASVGVLVGPGVHVPPAPEQSAGAAPRSPAARRRSGARPPTARSPRLRSRRRRRRGRRVRRRRCDQERHGDHLPDVPARTSPRGGSPVCGWNGWCGSCGAPGSCRSLRTTRGPSHIRRDPATSTIAHAGAMCNCTAGGIAHVYTMRPTSGRSSWSRNRRAPAAGWEPSCAGCAATPTCGWTRSRGG